MDFFQSRLVVECVNVADCSGAVDHENLLGGGIKMARPRGVGIVRIDVGADGEFAAESGRVLFCRKELRQPEAAERPRGILEEMTTVEKSLTESRDVFCFVHSEELGWNHAKAQRRKGYGFMGSVFDSVGYPMNSFFHEFSSEIQEQPQA